MGPPHTWTILGTLGSAGRSIVDQAGLVVPFGQCWSLDWWIGADDRWHLPSREAAVRQRLVSGAPVVETAMRVPGGDAIHRTYGVRGPRAEDLVAVEIENRSRVPFAVGLAIRPANPAHNDIGGHGGLKRIDHHDRGVTVDGRGSLVLPAPPRFTAATTGADGDLAGMVESGAASAAPLGCVRDPGGLAQAALLYPLAHGATLTVVIVDNPAETSVLPVPSAAGVARAWQAQTRRGMRLDLPEGALADAIDANRRFVYLFQNDVIALDHYGFHDDARRILAGRPLDDGGALWALGEHWRVTGDDELVRALAPVIAGAGRRIERRLHKPRRRRSDPESRGLLQPSYAANFWGLRGLLDGAQLLASVGAERAASALAGAAGALKRDLDASLGLVALRLGSRAIPAGPDQPLGAGCVDALVACTPLHLYEPTDPAITATLQVANEHHRVEVPGSPVPAEHALLLAAVDLERGDRRALAWLSRLVDQASPTWTWPAAGGGHDGRAAAGFSSLVRNLIVRDVPGGVAICTLVPEQWWGHSIEVHDAPTHAGVLSFAIRWHEDRPALLWELRRRHPNERIRLTAPGLDVDWHSEQPAGDAMLSPPAPSTRRDTGPAEAGFG